MPDTVYEAERTTLQAGDTPFLFTDGVTEANNPKEELYSELQLQEALRLVSQEDPAEMIHCIRAEVTRHANGAANQTMLP